MKGSKAMGTGSAFYLFDKEDVEEQDVFDEWNSIAIVPSLGPGMELMTKMSEYML